MATRHERALQRSHPQIPPETNQLRRLRTGRAERDHQPRSTTNPARFSTVPPPGESPSRCARRLIRGIMRECARGGFDRWAFLAGRQCQQLRGQGLDLTLDRGRVQRLVLAGQPVLHGLADGAGIGQDALEWCLRGVVSFGDLRPVCWASPGVTMPASRPVTTGFSAPGFGVWWSAASG